MSSLDAKEYPIRTLKVCSHVMQQAQEMLRDGDDSLDFLAQLDQMPESDD